MTVYADILITVNIIVDFILLKITAKILKISPKQWRLVTASAVGGIFSLYIFLPPLGTGLELLVKLLMSGALTAIGFKCKSCKAFLRTTAVLFTVTCCYAGVMIALWQIFSPKGVIIHNSVVYFNISPVMLIIFTALGYFLYLVFAKFFTPSAGSAKRGELTLFAGDKSINATAIFDTGNSLTDLLSDSEVIIGDKALLMALFGTLLPDSPDLQTRYRTLPCNTVSGTEVLQGFRCDSAKITTENRTLTLKKPILLAAKTPIKEDYSAILNPKILDIQGEENETEAVFLQNIK